MDAYNFWASVHCPPRKNYWLELGLGGTNVEYAVSVIRRENPSVEVIVMPQAAAATVSLENKCGRVRVFVDENGIVTQVPYEG